MSSSIARGIERFLDMKVFKLGGCLKKEILPQPKFELIFYLLFILHSMSRTFYSRDLDNIDTYILGFLFLCLGLWLGQIKDYSFKFIVALYVLSCLVFANDTYFSTASWNYINLGKSMRLDLPIISFYGDIPFSDGYKNLIELGVGLLSKWVIISKDPQTYFDFYRFLNIFVILGSLWVLFFIFRSYSNTSISRFTIRSIPVVLACFLLFEGAHGHYLKHSMGLLLALLSLKYLDDLFKYDLISSWVRFCIFFSVLCVTVETYPVIILAIFGIFAFLRGFEFRFVSTGIVLCSVFGFSLYFIYGVGREISFFASPQTNYDYIQSVVYGHPYKFYIGILFYIVLLSRSFYNLFLARRAFNAYDIGILSSLVILLVAFIDVRFSPIFVVFHRFIYLLLIFGIVNGSLMLSIFREKWAIVLLLAALSVNNLHHLYLFQIEHTDFRYNAVLAADGRGDLPFDVLDEFSTEIGVGSLVHLDERFVGHSVVNFWFNSRPFFVVPGLISSVGQESDLAAEKNLAALKGGRAGELAAPPEYMVTMSPDLCTMNNYSVEKQIADWYLCVIPKKEN